MGLPAPSQGPEHGHGVTGEGAVKDVLRGRRRVVVIGVHGWFPGTMIRTLAGEVSYSSLFTALLVLLTNNFLS